MSAEPETQINRFVEPLRNWRNPSFSVDRSLAELLNVTNSRAVGLWRVEGRSLRMVGFQAAADMPPAVREGFVEATRVVPLDQTGLGIVKAVLNREATLANVEAGETGLSVSASWLARFAALQSLAVPIRAGEKVLGVLAVSSANPFVEGDEVWRLLQGIAAGLGG